MTYYRECKHTTDGMIILDDNELSICAYLLWSESVGVFGKRLICFDCWCKNKEMPL